MRIFKVRKVKALLITLVALSLLVIPACSKNPQPANSSGTTPPQSQEDPKENKESSAKDAFSTSEQYSKLLTVAEVEKIGGFEDVKTVEKNPSIGAGGDLNFASADDLILIVQIQDASLFNTSKASSFYKKDLSGLGEKAFWGSSGMGDSINGLAFLQGNKTVSIVGFYDMNKDMKPYFSEEQLLELANLMSSRL